MILIISFLQYFISHDSGYPFKFHFIVEMYNFRKQSRNLFSFYRFLTESLEFKGIQPDSQVIESQENTENVDCQVSEWSNWSKCAGCRGYTESTREILVNIS